MKYIFLNCFHWKLKVTDNLQEFWPKFHSQSSWFKTIILTNSWISCFLNGILVRTLISIITSHKVLVTNNWYKINNLLSTKWLQRQLITPCQKIPPDGTTESFSVDLLNLMVSAVRAILTVAETSLKDQK